MPRLRLLPLLLVAALFGASGSFSQEKKESSKDVKETKKEKDVAPKLKGSLPNNWGKLGLSDDQKQNVYKIQGQYRDEIEKLQAKIDDLKAKQKKDLDKVLTDEQKKNLREILLGESK